MSMDRRTFLTCTTTAALAASPILTRASSAPTKIKAVAFDGFVIFDPRPISALVENLFPGKGAALVSTWRTRQFEYTWLRNSMGTYVDFAQVTEQALVFACKLEKLELTAEKRAQLLHAFHMFAPWPDTLQGLKDLKAAGIRTSFLANLTPAMMSGGVANSGLDGLFDDMMTTDRVKVFKPDPRAYQMGIDGFKLQKEEIAFAAFGGWDAAGASQFGYPTIWVNRLNLPIEELSSPNYVVGSGMKDVVAFVLNRNKAVS
ncbi:MAG: haloacid dehalogenase type II [Burkholderiaceae bacterium]|nr:haloacid dehalogenase type II [Burkholderiaceae bacterium]